MYQERGIYKHFNYHSFNILIHDIVSGAGKTVSAKYIMRYFATADDKEVSSGKEPKEETMTEVEEQILGNGK